VPHTLLLADDSLTIRRVVELTFADQDIRVLAVGDGSEALAALDRTPPDIVLVDAGMPGVNGYQVARHIKDTPQLAHIPVLLLTGAFEPVDNERVDAAGCDGVLVKPFEPQLVVARVRELLGTPTANRDTDDTGPASAVSVAAATARPSDSVGERPNDRSAAALDEYLERLSQALTASSGSRVQVSSAPAPDSAGDASRETPSGSGSAAVPQSLTPPPASPLAEAFSALLAAEQAFPGGLAAASPAATPWSPEGLVDVVTRRVIERLPEALVQEHVAAIVSAVAERLIRDEIERIKKSIADGDSTV
jgi:CheY-like chemotaxis protein